MKPITKLFLTFEEHTRQFFEKVPFLQAFIAGIGVIIFWRGVWEFLDTSGVTPIASVILGALLLVSVGVFIQTFIGNTIIIKEVKQDEKIEKKVMKKMEEEVGTETVSLTQLSAKLDLLIKKMDEHR